MKRMPKHEKSPWDMVGARFYESSRETTGRSSPPTASATQDPSACRQAPRFGLNPKARDPEPNPRPPEDLPDTRSKYQEPKATHTKVQNGHHP